jgi:hypothetical protein
MEGLGMFLKSQRLVGYYFQRIVEDFRSEWRLSDQFCVTSFLIGQPSQQVRRRRLESPKERDFDSLTSQRKKTQSNTSILTNKKATC